MWWNKVYVNRRDWILENQGVLQLTSEEIMVLLMIDLYNQKQTSLNLDILAGACALEVKEVDRVIQTLMGKKYLEVRVQGEDVTFNVDGIFENGTTYEYVDENIFKIFENEFGRLLSQQELTILNEWLSLYTQDEILEALKSAIIRQKTSMRYIEAILVNARKERQ